ncbi:MAG: DUF255 domain-containing protein [Planctomycetota bacterium]
MRRSLCLLAALAALASPQSMFADEGGVPWRTDARAAMAEAQQSGKLVLMHFWTESCGPCRVLDKRVFAQPGVAGAIVANYVPVKVNAADAPDLARAYNVTRVPTDVVTDSNGQVIRSFVSPATPMAYVGLMTELAAQRRTQSSPYGELAANAPYTVNDRGTTPVDPTPFQFKAEPPAEPQPVAPRVTMNPNYQPVAPQVAQRGPGVADEPPVAPAQPNFAEPRVAQRSAVEPGVAQPGMAQPVVAQPRIAQPATPAPAAADRAVAAPQQRAAASPQLPPGSPPLAFDGYCPVTMKKNWEWRKGDVRFGAIHRGRTYLFLSGEARDEFLNSPDDYAPALSGADPVLAVDNRRNVPGTRQHAVEYRGRFYFFASEETLSRFWTNAQGYASGAERVALAAPDTIVR